MKTLRRFCSTCRVYVNAVPLERLPTTVRDGSESAGIIWQHVGTTHKWVDYSSEDMFGIVNPDKSKPDPKIIKCPKCGKQGRINAQRRYLKKKVGGSDKAEWNRDDRYIRYIVTHEKLPGSWGHRVVKRRRCCITSQKDRDYVLKKLGRYIT